MGDIKSTKSSFSCPIGNAILWWHKIEYKECPLVSSHRDMPECKDCKLRVIKEWKGSKETWKYKPKKKKRNNKKYGQRTNRRGNK